MYISICLDYRYFLLKDLLFLVRSCVQGITSLLVENTDNPSFHIEIYKIKNDMMSYFYNHLASVLCDYGLKWSKPASARSMQNFPLLKTTVDLAYRGSFRGCGQPASAYGRSCMIVMKRLTLQAPDGARHMALIEYSINRLSIQGICKKCESLGTCFF